MSQSQSVDITIYGKKLVMRGGSDPAYMQELARKVDERIKAVAKADPKMQLDKAAVLACLNLMDEFTKVTRLLDAERQRMDQASRSVAHLDLKLQAVLSDAVQGEAPKPALDVEETPEVLDFEEQLRDLFDEGGKA